MRRANYDKFPSTKVDGNIWLSWKDIRSELSGRKLLAVDFYTGVIEEEVIEAFAPIGVELVINTRDLLKPEAEIRRMTERFMTDDVLFGYVTNTQLSDYFQQEKVKLADRTDTRKCVGDRNGSCLGGARNGRYSGVCRHGTVGDSAAFPGT